MVTLSYIHHDDPIKEERFTNLDDAIKRAKRLQSAYTPDGFTFVSICDSKTQEELVNEDQFKAM